LHTGIWLSQLRFSTSKHHYCLRLFYVPVIVVVLLLDTADNAKASLLTPVGAPTVIIRSRCTTIPLLRKRLTTVHIYILVSVWCNYWNLIVAHNYCLSYGCINYYASFAAPFNSCCSCWMEMSVNGFICHFLLRFGTNGTIMLADDNSAAPQSVRVCIYIFYFRLS
jgi:hypothetical protein